MSDEAKDPGAEESEPSWLGHRKRIVAREVRNASKLQPGDLGIAGATNRTNARAPDAPVVGASEAADPSPVFDPPPPRPPGLGAFMLDPTTLGDRRRVHGHNRTYRITLLLIVATWMGIAACVAMMKLDHVLRARAASTLTIILALAGVRLALFNKLSRRLLGYAVVSAVVACITCALCLTSTFARKPESGPAHIPSNIVHAPANP